MPRYQENFGDRELSVRQQEIVPLTGTGESRSSESRRNRLRSRVQTMIGLERKNSETRTWASVGMFVGAFLGALLAIAEVIWFSARMGSPDPGVFSQLELIGFGVVPLLLIFFGGFAGALVGVGTPRHNPHPQQGGGRAYHFYGKWNQPGSLSSGSTGAIFPQDARLKN